MAPLPPQSCTPSDNPIAPRYTLTTLDPLPSEIKRLILDSVIRLSSQSELLPLLRTCSSLYAECAPLIYKEVVLGPLDRAKAFFDGLLRPRCPWMKGGFALDKNSARRTALLIQHVHPMLKGYPPVMPKYILLGLVRKLVLNSGEAADVAWSMMENSCMGRESIGERYQYLFAEGQVDGEDIPLGMVWLPSATPPGYKLFSGLEWLVITQEAMTNSLGVSQTISCGVEGRNVCFQLPYDPGYVYKVVAQVLSKQPWEHVVLHNVHVAYFSGMDFSKIKADRVTIYAAQETEISDPKHSVHWSLKGVDDDAPEYDMVDNFIMDVVADVECNIPNKVARLTICDPPGNPLWDDMWMRQWTMSDRWENLEGAIVVLNKSESSCCEGCGKKVLPWI